MTTQSPLYVLERTSDHFGPDANEDTILLDLEKHKHVTFDTTVPVKLKRIELVAYLPDLKETDFPIMALEYFNQEHGSSGWLNWPILSKKMYQILQSIGKFSVNEIEVLVIDCTVDFKESEKDKNAFQNNDYLIAQLLEHTEVIDENLSEIVYSRSKKRIRELTKFVITEPAGGFPPFLIIKGCPWAYCVSEKAKKELEKESIKGIRFIPIFEHPFFHKIILMANDE